MSTVIPYTPDECKLTFRWSTDVLKSSTGFEPQRICLEPLPDILIENTYSFDSGIRLFLQSQKLRAYTDVLETYEIPWYFEAIGASALGATTIDVVEADCGDWAIVNRRVFVSAKDTEGTAGTISTVTSIGGGLVRLTLNVNISAYSLATVTICPLYEFQPEDGLTQGFQRDGKSGSFVFRGRLTTAPTLGVGGAGTLLTFLDGKYINDFRPLQDDEEVAGEEYQAGLEFTDFGGSFFADSGYAVADILRDEVYTVQGLAEWRKMKGFLYAVKGQQLSFWTPSWKPDLNLYTQPTPETADIRVTLTPDIRTYRDLDGHEHIFLVWSDGIVDYMTMDTVDDNGDHLQITTTSDLSFSDGEVTIIGLIEKTRLSRDEVVVTIRQGCTMDVALGLQTVAEPAA